MVKAHMSTENSTITIFLSSPDKNHSKYKIFSNQYTYNYIKAIKFFN